MIERLLIKWFGLNYQTTIAGIFTVISLIPGAITVVMKLYEGSVVFPPWVMVISCICTFIGIIYFGVTSKSKSVTGVNGGAQTVSKGELKTEKQMLKGD